MGELAFGESFQMLENAETHWAIELLNGGMEHLALFRTLLFPWMWATRRLIIFFSACLALQNPQGDAIADQRVLEICLLLLWEA